MESLYGRTIGRVVRIGASPARFISVSQKYVEFLDEEGGSHSIDLEDCAKNWVAWSTDHQDDIIPWPGVSKNSASDWNSRCVGTRGALDTPPWMTFTTESPTMFEFQSRDELYEELLGPLIQLGWRMFDTD